VTPGWNIPLNAVLVSLLVTTLLSLINIGSTAALNAILSLNVGSLLTSYMVCIGCVLVKRIRGQPLPPRRWTLGKFGMAINIISLAFLLPFFVFTFFPSVTPTNAVGMNWGSLMYGFMIIFSTCYYFVVGKKVYGPPLEKVHRELQE
jgi:amino acid transporter